MSLASHSSYQIGRSPGRCSVSGRPLEPGEPYIAALSERDGDEGFERIEFSESAWDDGARPARLFGFWRATVPHPNDTPKLLIDDEAMLELFDSLDGATGDKASFRFVLALILMRKRLLKHVGQRHTSEGRCMLVRRKGDASDTPPVEVDDPDLQPSEVETIAAQLEPVLRGDA